MRTDFSKYFLLIIICVTAFCVSRAEAVAQHHFGKSAEELTRSDCALIAATLPNPKRYSSKVPSKYMRKRQNEILNQMRLMGK